MNPPDENQPVPRLVPNEPFPPYSFVPGRFPHPESDPTGHSYGFVRSPTTPLDPKRWQESRTYLYGLDLFNAGFYWESHVAFEACGWPLVVKES